MADRESKNKNQTQPLEDYAAWIKRLLKIALDGGPHVVSARALADMYRGIGDPDLQVQAAIRDAKRAMRARAELKRAVALLVQEGILNERDAQGIASARWFVHARLATAIALVYGHDPETDWVQAAILVSIDRTPVQEEVGGEAEQEGQALWKYLLTLGAPALKKLFARYGASLWATVGLKPQVLAGAVLTLLVVIAPRLVAFRHARRCQQTGEKAQRGFWYLGLPSTTEKAVAGRVASSRH